MRRPRWARRLRPLVVALSVGGATAAIAGGGTAGTATPTENARGSDSAGSANGADRGTAGSGSANSSGTGSGSANSGSANSGSANSSSANNGSANSSGAGSGSANSSGSGSANSSGAGSGSANSSGTGSGSANSSGAGSGSGSANSGSANNGSANNGSANNGTNATPGASAATTGGASIAKAAGKLDPLADLPPACEPIAKRLITPSVAQAMAARIALANCLADARLRPLTLLDTQESMLEVEAATAASVALLDDVIARGDPKSQLLAHHAKLQLLQGTTSRMLASVPPAAQPTPEAAQLRDTRRELLEIMLAPWRAQMVDEARIIGAIAKANPALQRDAVVASALRDSKRIVPDPVATR